MNTIQFQSYKQSNEQTGQTSKIKTDSEIENRLTALWLGSSVLLCRIAQKRKRTPGHRKLCVDCGRRGMGRGRKGHKGGK